MSTVKYVSIHTDDSDATFVMPPPLIPVIRSPIPTLPTRSRLTSINFQVCPGEVIRTVYRVEEIDGNGRVKVRIKRSKCWLYIEGLALITLSVERELVSPQQFGRSSRRCRSTPASLR